MAPASRQYTLVGFSTELDWRPLTFLKPVPANLVCSACGLVRKRTALLPCMHMLCECCYEHCCQDGSQDCPLDGNRFENDDVTLTDYPADGLLRREVKCWNEGSGCQYSAAASGIAEHFQRECEHHSVRCPKCSDIVLYRDVCRHLRSTSCNTSMRFAHPPGHTDETVSVASMREALERHAGEIAAYLRPITVDSSTHGDRLNEISHGMNTLKETLCQELASLSRKTEDSVMKSVLETASSNAELKESFATCSDTANTCLRTVTNLGKALNDKLTRTRDDLSRIETAIGQVEAEVKKRVQRASQPCIRVVTHSLLQVTQCEFLVKGMQSLRRQAMKEGAAEYESEKVYLRGYCMSPGISLQKSGTGTALFAIYTLLKGDMDDDVHWPFQHKLTLRIVHPSQGADRVLEAAASPNLSCNRKPTAVSSNPPGRFTGHLSYCFLITEGYIAGDRLRFELELKP